MVRRVATQVHRQVARLLRSNYIQREPAWYQAVLDHPPIPLPPRATANRSAYDLPLRAKPRSDRLLKPAKMKTPPVVYIEDEVRRQFFRDHPFEAFRERTLVEAGTVEEEHPVRGTAWVRLSQRGRNSSPEDAVRFAVNLHVHHNMSLSQAYARAVTQFRSLRSEQHIATAVAAAEVEAYGGEFGPREAEIGFAREAEHLRSWDHPETSEQESLGARKKWRAIIERTGTVGEWTRGEEYVRLWKEGIRPNYALALSTPTTSGVSDDSHFLHLQQQVNARTSS